MRKKKLKVNKKLTRSPCRALLFRATAHLDKARSTAASGLLLGRVLLHTGHPPHGQLCGILSRCGLHRKSCVPVCLPHNLRPERRKHALRINQIEFQSLGSQGNPKDTQQLPSLWNSLSVVDNL